MQNPNLVSLKAQTGIFSDWFSICCIQFKSFIFILLPHLGVLVMALKKEDEIKPFVISSCFGFFFASSFMWFGGLAARALYPGIANADDAIVVYVLKTFSPVFAGIVISGIVAAVLSTASGLLLSMGTIITNDIFRINKNKILFSRIAMFFIGIVALCMSLNRPKSLAIFTQFGISAILSGVTTLLVYAHFGKKKLTSSQSCMIFILGPVVYLVLTFFGIEINIFKALFWSCAVSFLFLSFIITRKSLT
jgi:Na+/proline symporter